MNGNVFECYDEQSDRRQYAKTVEALMGYVKKNLKCAEDLKSTVCHGDSNADIGEADKARSEARTKPTLRSGTKMCATMQRGSVFVRNGSNSGRYLGPVQQGYESENEIPGRI
jgi:hypothetical protein